MAVGESWEGGGPQAGNGPEVLALPDLDAIARVAAERIAGAARAAVAERDVFYWALSGGSTPERVYGLLAAPSYDQFVPWEHVHLFWGDERCVPANHDASNYGMVRRSGLLERPLAGVHPMPGELPPEEGARAYEAAVREAIPRRFDGAEPEAGDRGGPHEVPVLDLIMLGLGADGHTASLFPGSAALREEERVVRSVEQKGDYGRLTFTPPVLAAARELLFLVAGERKEHALRAALRGDAGVPAGLVGKRSGSAVWLVEDRLLR